MNNASNNTTTTQLHGGATRVSFNQGDTSSDAPAQTSLSGTQGGGRVTMRDGSSTTESFTHSSVNQADVMAEARSNARGILETARQPHGSLGGKLSGSSVVTVNGMETSLAAAERMGFVMRNASGDYVETGSSVNSRESQGQQQQQAQSQPQGDQQGDQSDYIELHPEAEQVINQLIEPLSQNVYQGVIQKAINYGAESLDYQKLAEQMDTTPADAMKRVEFIFNAYKAPADRAVSAIVGTEEVESLYTWAAENAPAARIEAMQELIFGNSVAKLKALAVKFMRNSNPTDEALEQGGFPTKTASDGTRLIRVEGMWMSLSAAVKQGLV